MNKQRLICERLKKFGYASQGRIRLYGEDLQLVSNAAADEIGYSVLAMGSRSGNLRQVRIPLAVVSMLERELEREEAGQLAA
jgi:F420-0:gamma-glutamyl ligase